MARGAINLSIAEKNEPTGKSGGMKNGQKPKGPPGKIKLANALRQLLEEKDFNSITTAEIAATAGTNEALIYRYFGDKRGLLHQILSEYMQDFEKKTNSYTKNIKNPIERLKKLILDCFTHYSDNLVFARVVFVEARNFAGYFQSETYQLVRNFAWIVTEIIKDGMKSGEIRADIPATFIRDSILGSIEHFVIPAVLFGKKIDPENFTKILCEIILHGVVVGKPN